MTVGELFEAPTTTRELLMRAAYRALCAHGYADLTIQRIGKEFPKSTSLVYHHYESKDELLLDFLAFMLEHFEAAVPAESDDSPDDELTALLDHALPTEPAPEATQFTRAMIELRTQAATNTAYREQFTAHSAFFHARVVDILHRGIDDGSFHAVDADRVAAVVVAAIEGTMLQRATTDDAAASQSVSRVRAELSTYLDARVRRATESGSHRNRDSDEPASDTNSDTDTDTDHSGPDP